MSDATEKDWLRTPAAAEYLGLMTSTLRNYRFTGRGPKSYRQGGRVYYLRADLDKYQKSLLPQLEDTQ